MQENSEEELVRSESEGVVEGDEFSETSREEDQSAEEGDADEISSVSDEENKELPLPSQNVSSKNSAQDHMSLDDLTSTLQKTQDEDRKKGRAISRQIVRSVAICSRGSQADEKYTHRLYGMLF